MNKTDVKQAIATYQALLRLMEKDLQELSYSQAVFLAYIRKGRLDDAAKFLRENSIKQQNGNAITPPDISKMLELKPKDVHSGVIELVYSKFKNNRSNVPYWVARY